MYPFGVFKRVFVKIFIRIGWMVLKWEAATNKGKRGSYRQTDRHTDTSPPEVIIFNSEMTDHKNRNWEACMKTWNEKNRTFHNDAL